MKTRDELISILDRGWQAARSARHLLATDQRDTVDPTDYAPIGLELDRLAYELHQLGNHKPGRLAYSVAFILNGLASDAIPLDRNLIDKTSQLLAILAEMLLKLEVSTDIKTQEPAEIVEHLQAEWGLVIDAEAQLTPRVPSPHFGTTTDAIAPSATDDQHGLAALSTCMVSATESLMDRVNRLTDFPYSPAVSRVHHLATTIRDRVTGTTQGSPRAAVEADRAPKSMPITDAIAIGALNMDNGESNQAIEESMPAIAVELPPASSIENEERNPISSPLSISPLIPHVLIIDESPFFRMLLTSAIGACGFSIHAVSNLQEVVAGSEIPSSLIICGTPDIIQNLERLRDCHSSALSPDASIILLTSDVTPSLPVIANCHYVRRTDLSGLLDLIATMYGGLPREIRRSA